MIVKHPRLEAWIESLRDLCEPDHLIWCDGSPSQRQQLWDALLATGAAKRLNPELRPNSYLVRSDPADVARVEDRTFICSAHKDDAGPTNNWVDPAEMRATLERLFTGCMRGRTMYVIPFSMGPIGSPIAHIGVQITDSPYVAASMAVMTRVGQKVLEVTPKIMEEVIEVSIAHIQSKLSP